MDRLFFSAPFKAAFTNLGTSGRLLYSKTPIGANAPRDSLLQGGDLDKPAHPKI